MIRPAAATARQKGTAVLSATADRVFGLQISVFWFWASDFFLPNFWFPKKILRIWCATHTYPIELMNGFSIAETTPSEEWTTLASSNVPLTTFEVYDVENSTAENVTLEFVDLSTTEPTSSTQSVLQYLETASYKQGTHTFLMFLYVLVLWLSSSRQYNSNLWDTKLMHTKDDHICYCIWDYFSECLDTPQMLSKSMKLH